ncbi:MAG: hypothetical protein HND43_07125 [Armatimonadetes bacterium]|nr:hypothetical protein [Armatimonadota bacterium]
MKVAKTSLTPFAATLILVGTSAAIALSECVFRALYDVILRELPYPGLYLLYFAPLLTAAIAAVPLSLPHHYAGQKVVIVLASVTIAVFLVRFFRGSHLWVGFFDLAEDSPVGFYSSLALATALGFVLAKLLPKRITLTTVGVMTVLAVLWTWLDAFRGIRVVSEYPYSRHVALLGVTLLVPLAWGAQRLGILAED